MRINIRIHSLAGWRQELAKVTEFEALHFRLEFLVGKGEKWKFEQGNSKHLNTGPQMQEPERRNSKTAF